ncbi:MAG: ribonuclease P protein component [Clostridia bacterium]
MKRQDSLKRKKEFRYTYRVGKSQSSRLCALVYAKNRTKGAKIGFSVSKKIGNSVIRNRVKRRMREAATPLVGAMMPGYNVIFIARDAAKEAPFQQICFTMRTLLSRAGLLSPEESE